jgi:hypothetical protein
MVMATYRMIILGFVTFGFLLGMATLYAIAPHSPSVYANTAPPTSPDAELTAAGITISTPQDTQTDYAGKTVTYTTNVTNTGDNIDSYTVTIAGNSWTTTPGASSLDNIESGSSTELAVTVEIPADAATNLTDSFTLTLTAQSDPSVTGEQVFTTKSAGKIVTVSPIKRSTAAMPGSTTTYTIEVTNRSDQTDSFTIDLIGATWAVTSSVKKLESLEAGKTASFTIDVTIPKGAYGGSEKSITAKITPEQAPTISAESLLIIQAKTTRNFSNLISSYDKLSDKPGTVVTYTAYLTNTGNITESFIVDLSSNQWDTQLALSPYPGDVYDSQTNLTLSPTYSATFHISVAIPADAKLNSKDTATLTVTSTRTPALQDTFTMETTAGATYGVALGAAEPMKMGLPNTSVTYALSVTNTGNISDTFYISIPQSTWDTNVNLPGRSSGNDIGPLEVGETMEFAVTVKIPRIETSLTATYSDTGTTMIMATSNGNMQVSSAVTVSTTIEKPDVPSLEETLVTSPTEVIELPVATQNGVVGEIVTYRLKLSNKSLDDETVVIGGYGNAWTTTAAPAAILSAMESQETLIDSGASKQFDLQVSIPETAAIGDTDTITITVGVKDTSADKHAQIPITTTVVEQDQQQDQENWVYLPTVMK